MRIKKTGQFNYHSDGSNGEVIGAMNLLPASEVAPRSYVTARFSAWAHQAKACKPIVLRKEKHRFAYFAQISLGLFCYAEHTSAKRQSCTLHQLRL